MGWITGWNSNSWVLSKSCHPSLLLLGPKPTRTIRWMDTCDAVATDGEPTNSFGDCKDPGRSHVFLVDSKAPCSSEGIPRQGRDSWGTWQLDESWSLLENRELSMKNEDLPPEKLGLPDWSIKHQKLTKSLWKNKSGKRLFATEKHHLLVSVPTRSLYSNYPLVSTLCNTLGN